MRRESRRAEKRKKQELVNGRGKVEKKRMKMARVKMKDRLSESDVVHRVSPELFDCFTRLEQIKKWQEEEQKDQLVSSWEQSILHAVQVEYVAYTILFFLPLVSSILSERRVVAKCSS